MQLHARVQERVPQPDVDVDEEGERDGALMHTPKPRTVDRTTDPSATRAARGEPRLAARVAT